MHCLPENIQAVKEECMKGVVTAHHHCLYCAVYTSTKIPCVFVCIDDLVTDLRLSVFGAHVS